MRFLNNRPSQRTIPVLLACALLTIGSRPAAQETAQPVTQADGRFGRLIEQLGDEDYFARERAQAELAEMGFEAYQAVKAATTHRDLEIANRAKYLLQLMRVQWTVADDPREVVKLLGDYEHQDMPTKLSRMRSLLALPDRKGIAGLCRLVRFERSSVLSKHAALSLLSERPPDKESAELMRKHLGGSTRTGAKWAMAYVRLAEDPETALADWAKLVEAERGLLQQSASQSSREIVAELVRKEVAWLTARGRHDRAIGAMRRLIDLQQGNPKALAELLGWLVEQEAWPVVDELAARFGPQFAADPSLLYTLAETHAKRGNQDLAERTAARAVALNPGKDSSQLAKHYKIALDLRRRGLRQWAQREYRHVVDTGAETESVVRASLTELLDGLVRQKAWQEVDELADRFASRFADSPVLLYTHAQAAAGQGQQQRAEEIARKAQQLSPGTTTTQLNKHVSIALALRRRGMIAWARREYDYVTKTGKAAGVSVVTAQRSLSEMLHDQGKDLEAAQIRRAMVEAIEKNPGGAGWSPQARAQFRSRTNYFFACHYRSKNDLAKQREYLDQAIEADPTDTDALIACYRLPDQPEEYRRRILSLIEKATAEYRRQIARSSSSSTPYNQFAWLVANTRGDFSEALKYSKRSVELSPTSSSYLDTLAHVYFALGDYEMAYKTQTKAVELEPHAGLLAKQLEVFRKKWEETEKETKKEESE